MNKAIVIFFVLEYIKKNIKHLIMQSSILLKLILYYFFDLIFSFIFIEKLLIIKDINLKYMELINKVKKINLINLLN